MTSGVRGNAVTSMANDEYTACDRTQMPLSSPALTAP